LAVGLYEYRPKCLSEWKKTIDTTKYYTAMYCVFKYRSFAVIQLSDSEDDF